MMFVLDFLLLFWNFFILGKKLDIKFSIIVEVIIFGKMKIFSIDFVLEKKYYIISLVLKIKCKLINIWMFIKYSIVCYEIYR